jgi:hypothetical protein
MLGQHLREGDVLARRYLLRERIGAGGMSVIWRAWDDALQRTVAVKVLDGPVGTDHVDRELIRREARAAARIEHPNAIQVYDYGETVTPRGRIAAYVVMQLLDGFSLAERLAAGPLDWPEAVSVAATVADVLAAAHRRDVVHRDVTPENVMLTTDGVKLLDFGIAAVVGQREDTLTFGTPPYVAPERLAGATASGATDIYALGVLLFEALTGGPPFAANTWHELESASRQVGPIEVPGLPAPVAAICRRCLAIDPAERPSAEQVADGLSGIAASPRRRWWIPLATVVAAVAAFFLVLAGSGGIKGALTSPARLGTPTQSPIGAAAGSPSQAPAEVPAGPSSAAPATPPRARSSPAVPTVGNATAAVYAILDRRGAAGDIRPDVVEDLRNLVDALVANPAEPQPRVDGLRQQLRARQRERAMTSDAQAELDAAIAALGESLTRP